MSNVAGLMCLLIKSAQADKPVSWSDFDYTKPLRASPVGGVLAEGLLGAGLGAGMGGLYGYITAPDEIDPETGQQKSKWKNVWPAMGIGALGGGVIGTATGIHGAHGENQRFVEGLGDIHPDLKKNYMRFHGPDNIVKMLYGSGGLSDIGKNET